MEMYKVRPSTNYMQRGNYGANRLKEDFNFAQYLIILA